MSKTKAEAAEQRIAELETGQFDLPSAAATDAAAGSEDARGKWCWPAQAKAL